MSCNACRRKTPCEGCTLYTILRLLAWLNGQPKMRWRPRREV